MEKKHNNIAESDQAESKKKHLEKDNQNAHEEKSVVLPAGKEVDNEYKKQEKEIQNLHGQIIRLKAEFDNYRKRVEKEKELRFSYGKQTILIKLIGLVDIFDNALNHAKDSKHLKDVADGLKLTHKEFTSFIAKEGVKPIETIGLKFNPDCHEIVGFEQSEDGKENIILHEVQRGYLCNDEVIRPAKVIVAKKKDKTEESKS